MKKRMAFTLSELLMVVAILGLLMGMLLPSLVNALEFPHRTACLNNLKQMGEALYGYQSANNGCMPPFYNPSNQSAGHNYDWIWPDSLAPYISGKASGPGVESGGLGALPKARYNVPGKSIWACPNADRNPLLRTNYANTCGARDAGTWTQAANKAGLVMADEHPTHSTSPYDSYLMCNRYSQMDSRSIVLYCGRAGCTADPGFPDPASLPDDWNANSHVPSTVISGGIVIPFAHFKQNPALTVGGSVKAYGHGTLMGGCTGGDSRDTWVPLGNY